MPRSQIRKSVGNKVWRPQDEEARIPSDWERLAVHVVRGGLRAGNLAFALRATLMLVLELIKSLRTKKFNRNAFGIALLGPRNFRFAALFAIWASLYKAVHNGLRLMTPMPVKKSRSRAASASGAVTLSIEKAGDNAALDDAGAGSGTATPRSGRSALEGKSPEEKAKEKAKQKRHAFMRDPRSKVWHAYVAGAISALAVLVETPDNRIALAQQLFVRGLEGSYNVSHERGLINIPYGAVITFGARASVAQPSALPGCGAQRHESPRHQGKERAQDRRVDGPNAKGRLRRRGRLCPRPPLGDEPLARSHRPFHRGHPLDLTRLPHASLCAGHLPSTGQVPQEPGRCDDPFAPGFLALVVVLGRLRDHLPDAVLRAALSVQLHPGEREAASHCAPVVLSHADQLMDQVGHRLHDLSLALCRRLATPRRACGLRAPQGYGERMVGAEEEVVRAVRARWRGLAHLGRHVARHGNVRAEPRASLGPRPPNRVSGKLAVVAASDRSREHRIQQADFFTPP
ncbi:hypothetical protein L1887_57138 [Cichorium endivia]|nr:hypothetical protein L1887_57138 [Cichorium endivia]